MVVKERAAKGVKAADPMVTEEAMAAEGMVRAELAATAVHLVGRGSQARGAATEVAGVV